MRNKKGLGKGMSIFVALLLFSAAFAAFSPMIVDLGDTYGASDTTNLSTFNRMDSISANLTDLEERTRSGSVNVLSGLDIFFRGAYNALITLFNVPGIVGSIAGDIQGSSEGGLHIPGWAIVLIVSAITAVILSVIIGAIFKREV